MSAEKSSVYAETISFEHLTSGEILVLFVEAVNKLGWKTGPISDIGFNAYVRQSKYSGTEEVTIVIEGKSVFMGSRSISIQLVDVRRNQMNIEALFATVMELKLLFSHDDLSSKHADLKKSLVSPERSLMSQPPSTAREDLEMFLGIFKPRRGYFMTPILMNLNILVFLLMISSGVNFMFPDVPSLVKWGADDSQLTKAGEWWRLLTAAFLHAGIVHLFANMFAFYYIGLLLEPYLGPAKFILAYLLAAIAASATSLWWHPVVVGVGASGAIFGMYGVFLAMLTTKAIDHPSKTVLLATIVAFVAFNLVGGTSRSSRVDHAGHLGGLISGIIIGYAYLPFLKKDNTASLSS